MHKKTHTCKRCIKVFSSKYNLMVHGKSKREKKQDLDEELLEKSDLEMMGKEPELKNQDTIWNGEISSTNCLGNPKAKLVNYELWKKILSPYVSI